MKSSEESSQDGKTFWGIPGRWEESSPTEAENYSPELQPEECDAHEEWEPLFHSLSELENAPPLRFAIEGFLQEQGITFLGGLPGHGKTLLMLSIVKALLEGGNLFAEYEGFRVVSPAQRILYLTPEVSITPFRDRMRMFGLLEHVKDKKLFVNTLSAKEPLVNLADSRFIKAVEGADIFLDTAIRFMPGDENTAAENKQFASLLFALFRAGARCIIGAHHSSKGGSAIRNKPKPATLENTMRGSVDIGAMLSAGWSVRQTNKGTNRLRIENVKARDFEAVDPFEVQGRPYLEQNGRFRMVSPPPKQQAVVTTRHELARSLRQHGLSQQDVAKRLEVDRSTISKWEKEWKRTAQSSGEQP